MINANCFVTLLVVKGVKARCRKNERHLITMKNRPLDFNREASIENLREVLPQKFKVIEYAELQIWPAEHTPTTEPGGFSSTICEPLNKPEVLTIFERAAV